MTLARAAGLFVVTALAEILGCYLPYLWLRKGRSAFLRRYGACEAAIKPYLWLRKGRSAFLLAPAALSLAAFALAPHASPDWCRPHLRGVRRRLRDRRDPLAVGHRAGATDAMGHRRLRRHPGRMAILVLGHRGAP